MSNVGPRLVRELRGLWKVLAGIYKVFQGSQVKIDKVQGSETLSGTFSGIDEIGDYHYLG